MLITEAFLGSLFIQTFLYGLSTATFVRCLNVLIGNAAAYQSSAAIRRGLVIVVTIMFINATISSLRLLWLILEAFIHVVDEPGRTDWVLFNAKISASILFSLTCNSKSICYMIQTLLGDGVLLFRTWVVYNRSWTKVSIPLILLLLDFGLACRIVFLKLVANLDDHINGKRFATAVISYVALTLVCNVLCTAMITGRIWAVTRKAASMCLYDSRESRRGYLHTTARIVLESGLLYAVSIAVQLGTGALKSNMVYPVADCTVPIISICFNLIIVRANWQWCNENQRGTNELDISDNSSFARAVDRRVRDLSIPPASDTYNDHTGPYEHSERNFLSHEDPIRSHHRG